VGFEVPLWRAVAVFRVASLGYAAALLARSFPHYRHPLGGWFVLGVMALWTGYAVYAFADPARRRWRLLTTDLLVAAGCLLATAWVETFDRINAGKPTLPMAWVAGAVLAWAISGGKRGGAVAAFVIAAAGLGVHRIAGGGLVLTQATGNGIVLVFLAGVVVGHGAKLAIDAEARLARAIELEAATRERERLARRIHDSVLQVLALVQRRGSELGGEAAELGRLAGEQEAALRALMRSHGGITALAVDAEADLRTLLTAHASMTVTVSTPASAVRLPMRTAREIEAAVVAALDNVRRHCGDGVRAWVLLETGEDGVTVSVRDEGPGMSADRLAAAEADGRLGVAQSIRGRIRDLGGTVSVVSAPEGGTEIEMSVPVPAA
jgi:signal transduction histidine kinase